MEKNPSCDIRAYTGGQSCCHHLFTLLDKNQTTPWQDQPLEYHHKWRIYYQDADPVTNPIQGVTQFNVSWTWLCAAQLQLGGLCTACLPGTHVAFRSPGRR